jgi:hypothetical protein
MLLSKTPPLFAQERELKLVKVRMDQVAHLQLPAVLATEVQGQKGHNIVGLSRFAMPNLYAKHLVKLDDLVDKVGREGGGWTNKEVGKGGDGQCARTLLPRLEKSCQTRGRMCTALARS